MSKPVNLFTGHALYLDTMIPYALLRGIEPEARLTVFREENSLHIHRH